MRVFYKQGPRLSPAFLQHLQRGRDGATREERQAWKCVYWGYGGVRSHPTYELTDHTGKGRKSVTGFANKVINGFGTRRFSKRRGAGAGGMAQRLRALTTVVEKLSSVPSTHIVAPNIRKSSFKGSDTLF